MKKLGLGIAVVCALITAGCKSQAVQSEQNQSQMTTPTKTFEIEGEWVLIDMKSHYMTDETLEDLFPVKIPFMVVDAKEMMIYGNNGCNVYRGPIKQLDEQRFILDKGVASTLKYCSGVKQTVYMQVLGEVKEYKVENDTLLLHSKDEKVYLKFKKSK
ncbi:META domain-containing protein [Myroides sp. NP-2]|uniref:META domain-containing protein n=1 Tax=Myroides sp. NP-2 TaxID=2759945 RepID=UPI0015FC8EF3|nr:META domain-containing protein [Myroides sp. NP-2]MBB1151105.1 META domain-containing protein [Myroides sp. NP-2]